MADIKDKIAKLLALAGDNPSESEAKAALLKARKLMAENKLRPEECQKAEMANVVESLVGVTVTARKYAWGVTLSGIIGKHYCCVAFRRYAKGKQTQKIGFVGLEDDFEICSRIFRYAFECVKQTSDEIFKEGDLLYDASIRRKRAEAYGYAFCSGLESAFSEQQKEHQEWGLVMVVPQAVRDTEIGQMKGSSYGNTKGLFGAITHEAMQRGYEDGRKFDPATRLAQAKAPLALGDAADKKWCAEIVQDFDGRYYANLTIDSNLIGGLPEYVAYETLKEAVFERTGIRLPAISQLDEKYWLNVGRKKYAYIDATQRAEGRLVTAEEVRNGWKPSF